MSARIQIPEETKQKQEIVSDPAVSAWVSANAGSGKTTVLVRRVIRLLLRGTPPARILCLTFTKAAAANMANKVLGILGGWVRLDDAALDEKLKQVIKDKITPALRSRARRLFAEAIETPGGLKVQTIHAFCDRVLHQFPFEAKVPAGFEVLDDVRESDLLRRARDAVMIEASGKPDSELGRALAITVAAASDDSFDKALAEAVRARRKTSAADVGMLAKALGLSPNDTVASVAAEILGGPCLPRSEWAAAGAALLPLGGNAQKLGEGMLAAAGARRQEAAAEGWIKGFFTGEGKPYERKNLGSKDAIASEPSLYEKIFSEQTRLIPLRDKLFAAHAMERTSALTTLALAVIKRYEDAKRTRGELDYADLIERTAGMLSDLGSAWVLYKLDGGIDHVLVDEAQDTSPEQWEVIEKLTEEFFAGQGARGSTVRTIFAVGDDKQSIFSFQGAEPKQFAKMKRHFETRITSAGFEFRNEQLKHSFRSALTLVEAFDTVFKRPEAYTGLSSGGEKNPVHDAIRKNAPALVEIWDTETRDEQDDGKLPWEAPLDAIGEESPTIKLAKRIARAVKHWTEGGLAIEDRDTGQLRTPNAGDVIVLVRRRGALFEAVLQELKHQNIAVAGADRLKLAEHIAVMDLMALGDALTLEADDLALACVLKSPLFNLSEEELFTLAQGRKGTLTEALIAQSADNARLRAVSGLLEQWRHEAAHLRPFDFYSRVLGRDGGREKMLGRLGAEAADAIDEFLAGALSYEQLETPSLAGFLKFLRRADTEVKRDLEVESSAVRVMTVHGAKGLEAPLVILADTTAIPEGKNTKLHDLPDGAFVWAGNKNSDSAPERLAREAAKAAREAEYRRLLYVALTRAADALIVCGSEGKRMDDGCWYRLVRTALGEDSSSFLSLDTEYGNVWRWRAPKHQPVPTSVKMAPQSIPLPAFLERPAARANVETNRVRPSDSDHMPEPAAAEKAGRRISARRRGDLLHRLLQFLPEQEAESHEMKARQFLQAAASDLASAELETLAAEAVSLLANPGMAALFGARSLPEVSFLSRDPVRNEEIRGRIDRLFEKDGEIIIVDYKTDANPPKNAGQMPEQYKWQLDLYRKAAARIYPGKTIRTLLVYTRGPQVIELKS